MKACVFILNGYTDFYPITKESFKRNFPNLDIYRIEGPTEKSYYSEDTILYFDDLDLEHKFYVSYFHPSTFKLVLMIHEEINKIIEHYDRIIISDDDIYFFRGFDLKEYELAAVRDPFSRNTFSKVFKVFNCFNFGFSIYSKEYFKKAKEFVQNEIFNKKIKEFFDRPLILEKEIHFFDQWSISEFFFEHSAKNISDKLFLGLNEPTEDLVKFAKKYFCGIHYIKNKKEWLSLILGG